MLIDPLDCILFSFSRLKTPMSTMKNPIVVTCLVVMCMALQCVAVQPGLKTTITSAGLDYATKVAVEIVEGRITTVDIPNISGSAETPVGHIDYTLSSIVLSQVKLPTAKVALKAGTGVDVSVSDVSAHVTMNWHYREHSWPHVSDSGSADISVGSTGVAVSMGITEVKGEPQLDVTSSTASVGHLDIDLHGGASWLYNLFVSAFSGDIRHSVESALSSEIKEQADDAGNQALASLPTKEDVGCCIYVDYALTSDPLFTDTTVITAHQGEFFDKANPTPSPFTPTAMPDVQGNDMLQIFLSEFVVQSAGYAEWQSGQIQVNITNNDIPANSPIHLNTSDWKILLPELPQHYPNMLMMLEYQVSNRPDATFSPTGASVNWPSTLTVYVLNGTQAPIMAFVLGLDVQASGVAALNATQLTGKLSFVNATVTLQASTIGQFKPEILQGLVNFLFKIGLIPVANEALAKGFPIPVVDGVKLTSASLKWGDGWLGVFSNFTYTPPEYMFKSGTRMHTML